MKKQHKDRHLRESVLASGVIAAFLAGIFSIIVSCNNNIKLNQIENQKYQYDLHMERYEKLQESLEYFSAFQVYSDEFIHKFDVASSEYTLENSIDMVDKSLKEFRTNLYLLRPYLSDKAISALDKELLTTDEIIREYPIAIDDMMDDDAVNKKLKEHFEQVNEEFDWIASVIINVIIEDIHDEYVP